MLTIQTNRHDSFRAKLSHQVHIDQVLINLSRLGQADSVQDFEWLLDGIFDSQAVVIANRLPQASPYHSVTEMRYQVVKSSLAQALVHRPRTFITSVKTHRQDIFEFTFQTKQKAADIKLHLIAKVDKEGKIVQLEQLSNHSIVTVPGQVVAGPQASAAGFFTEEELGQTVHALPGHVRKHLIGGAGSGMIPSHRTGTVVKLFWQLSRWNTSVVDDADEPYAASISIKQPGRWTKQDHFVVRNGHGQPLVLAAKAERGHVLYGRKQLFRNDDLPDPQFEADCTFHPWFHLIDDHPDFLSLYTWEDGVPTRVFLMEPRSVGFVVRTSNLDPCANLLRVRRIDGKEGWELVLAPGVDPGMMLGVVCALDDIVEIE